MPKALLAARVAKGGGADSKEQDELLQIALDAIKQLATEVGDVAQICDALAGVLRQQSASPESASKPAALPTLECVMAAVQVIPKLKEPVRSVGECWLLMLGRATAGGRAGTRFGEGPKGDPGEDKALGLNLIDRGAASIFC